MGYRVDYQPVKKVRGMEKKTVSVPSLTALFFLLFLLLVNSAWPRGREVLQAWIFPGDRVVTAAALENLTEELRDGQSLHNALYTFCQRVIQEDSIA